MKAQDIAVREPVLFAEAFIAKATQRYDAWREAYKVKHEKDYPHNLKVVPKVGAKGEVAILTISSSVRASYVQIILDIIQDSYVVKSTVQLRRSESVGAHESKDIYADEVDALLDHAIPTMLAALDCWIKKPDASMDDVSLAIVQAQIPPLAIRAVRPADHRRNPRNDLSELAAEPKTGVKLPDQLPHEIMSEGPFGDEAEAPRLPGQGITFDKLAPASTKLFQAELKGRFKDGWAKLPPSLPVLLIDEADEYRTTIRMESDNYKVTVNVVLAEDRRTFTADAFVTRLSADGVEAETLHGDFTEFFIDELEAMCRTWIVVCAQIFLGGDGRALEAIFADEMWGNARPPSIHGVRPYEARIAPQIVEIPLRIDVLNGGTCPTPWPFTHPHIVAERERQQRIQDKKRGAGSLRSKQVVTGEPEGYVTFGPGDSEEVTLRIPKDYAKFLGEQCRRNGLEMGELVTDLMMNMRVGELMAIAQASGKVHANQRAGKDPLAD